MKSKFTVSQLTMIGVMAAVTCILGPLSIPIGIIPISFTNLAVYFAIYALGWKKGTISFLIYLLMGLIGVPVFSAFSSGPAKLFGPTGGYLIGFIFMAIVSGIFIDKFYGKWYLHLIGMVVGTAISYLFGTTWLAYSAGMEFTAAIGVGIIPFIPGDLVKIIIALLVGPQIRKQLIKANLYQ